MTCCNCNNDGAYKFLKEQSQKAHLYDELIRALQVKFKVRIHSFGDGIYSVITSEGERILDNGKISQVIDTLVNTVTSE